MLAVDSGKHTRGGSPPFQGFRSGGHGAYNAFSALRLGAPGEAVCGEACRNSLAICRDANAWDGG